MARASLCGCRTMQQAYVLLISRQYFRWQQQCPDSNAGYTCVSVEAASKPQILSAETCAWLTAAPHKAAKQVWQTCIVDVDEDDDDDRFIVIVAATVGCCLHGAMLTVCLWEIMGNRAELVLPSALLPSA